MFGKPGRPPEDRFQRRLEIWAAVAPLIEQVGARNLTMRQAAAASFMSLGGLYHYFPSKRTLVLFGLDGEAWERACSDIEVRTGRLRAISPELAAEGFCRSVVDQVFFVRPSMRAAMELGTDGVLSRLDVDMGLDTAFGLIASHDRARADLCTEGFIEALNLANAFRRRS